MLHNTLKHTANSRSARRVSDVASGRRASGKQAVPTKIASISSQIGLRLSEGERAVFDRYAIADSRSHAAFARWLVVRGLEALQRTEAEEGCPARAVAKLRASQNDEETP